MLVQLLRRSMAPSADDTYFPVTDAVFAAGRGRCFVVLPSTATVELDAMVGRALRACHGVRTLEAHAQLLMRGGVVAEPSAAGALLARMIEAGLLHAASQLNVRARGSTHVEITTVAIVTANRSRQLERCLRSFIENCQKYGRTPRFMVVDGSAQKVVSELNRRLLKRLGRETGARLQYVGQDEVLCLHGRLCSSGIDPATLEAGLTTGSTGAGRNIATLLTAGEHVLMVDDDVVCRPWSWAHESAGLDVLGHAWPQRTEFFATRQQAFLAAGHAQEDVLAAHARLLGQDVPTLLARRQGNLEDACGHVLDGLQKGRPLRVQITFLGIAGDSGTYCPYRHLFSSGATQEHLRSDINSYRRALTSREVCRGVSADAIAHNRQCIATCMAMVNTEPRPPFMPVGRNEDGVFGAMLTMCQPDTLFGYSACGVRHDSERCSRYDNGVIRSAAETRLSDVVIGLTQGLGAPQLSGVPLRRLQALGNAFEDIGHLPLEAIADSLAKRRGHARAQQLRVIDDMLCRTAEYPEYWRKDLEVFKGAVLNHLGDSSLSIPVECLDVGDRTGSLGRTRQTLSSFGLLMSAWPDLWTQSRDGIAAELR